MSYSITDAGEADMRKEINALQTLNEDVDQAAALARDCRTIAPEVAEILDIAWWIIEDAGRAVGHASCGHQLTVSDLRRKDIQRTYCACCAHFLEMATRGESARRRLWS